MGSPFYSRRVGWYSTITSLISQEAEISERSSSSHYASYRACDVVWSRIGLHWPTLKSDKEGSRESRAELWFSSCFIQYVRCGVMRILDSTDLRWILTMKRQRTKSGALVLNMLHTVCEVVRSSCGLHGPTLKPLTSLQVSQEFAVLWVSWWVYRKKFSLVFDYQIWCKYREYVLNQVKA